MSGHTAPMAEGGSKFKRRTSHHNLKLDVEKASAAGDSGITWSCRNFGSRSCDQCEQNNGHAGRHQKDGNMDPEVVEEGKHLFQDFVREQIRREGLLEPAKCLTPMCR